MSKGYSFSLQKVFDYRKNVEEKKAIELNLERINLKKRKNELNFLEDKKKKVMTSNSGDAEQEQVDLNNLKLRKDYIVQLNGELEHQSKKVEDANNKVEKSRGELLEASKDKKMLEKLNERKYEEFKKRMKQKQNKNEDEVAGRIAKYNKQKVSN